MSVLTDHLPALFGTLFGGTEGEVTLRDGDRAICSRDLDEIADFLKDADQPIVELVTDIDQVGAVAFICDPEEANLVVEQQGTPALALMRDDDVILVYALKEAVLGENLLEVGSLDSIPLYWEPTEQTLELLASGEIADYFFGQFATMLPEDLGIPAGLQDTMDAPTLDDAEPEPEERWNDARVIGEMAEGVLDLPISIGYGRKAEQRDGWRALEMSVGQLFHKLTQHAVGKKTGDAFLQGEAIDGVRKMNAMRAMFLVGLDVDCGMDIEQTVERLRALNLAACVYTTHSHLSTRSEYGQSAYLKWAKRACVSDQEVCDALVKRFMREDRRIEAKIADSAVYAGTTQNADGMQIVIDHEPLPKFRIVIPLTTPYVFAEQNISQKDAIDRWKGRVLGLEKLTGLRIDHACLDPSRLYYFPRHDAERAFDVVVTGGNALDLEQVPIINPREGTPDETAFDRAAREMGAGSSDYMVGDFNVKRWSVDRAEGFQILAAFEHYCPERIRVKLNDDKASIECPFDHEHSNAGDPDDQGCFIVNGQGEGNDGGFVFACQHNACKSAHGRDRLAFLCEAVSREWLPLEALSDDDFSAFLVAPEGENLKDRENDLHELVEEAENYRQGTPGGVIFNMFKKAFAADLSAIDLDNLTQIVQRKTKLTKTVLNTTKKQAQRAANRDDEGQVRLRKLLAARKSPVSDDKELVVLDARMGHSELRAKIEKKISLRNREVPTIFQYAGRPHLCDVRGEDGEVMVSGAEWVHLANLLEPILGLYKQTDDGPMSQPMPERILKEVLEDKTWHLPQLEGFAALPYYTRSATLVTQTGYNTESLHYLKPAPRFVMPRVPQNPSRAEIEAAVELLLVDVFGNFPFDDGDEDAGNGMGSRAHFMAMLIEPFIRPMIEGSTPINFVTKPVAGTGATEMINGALMITTGSNAPGSYTEKANNEEENRKTITSAFKSGKTYFWLDNINRKLDSAAYCNLATAPSWEDRELGSNTTVSFPNRLQKIFSGNNPRGTYEVMRRCLPIRLDLKGDPNDRDQSKLLNLRAYIPDNRSKLVGAVLTLINAWIAEGRPEQTDRIMMSFDSWSRLTGGILNVAGIPGFLTNMHLTLGVADEETLAWQTFIQQWVDTFGINDMQPLNRLVNGVVEKMPEYPVEIGLRPNQDEQVTANMLRRRLSSKKGAPFKVEHDGEMIVVTISEDRGNKESNRVHTFGIVPMKKKELV